MKLIRFSIRIILLLTLLIFGILTVGLVFPLLPINKRFFITNYWSKLLMFASGVKTDIVGEPISKGAALWVANHVSWIDIFILNSVRTTSFVAKQEIRKWPVIGWLVAAVGTIFIERGQRQAIPLINEKMSALYQQGFCVGLFPEGTTTEGFSVLPFKTALFEAAINSRVPIQSVALVFYHHNKRSGLVSFVGDQTLVKNIWVLLSSSGIKVKMVFLPILDLDEGDQTLGRFDVSEKTQQQILTELERDLTT